MTLTDLITRVEAATGPDRVLDVQLWYEFGEIPDEDPINDLDSGIPRWTASIDAVVELIRREMPGWGFAVSRNSAGKYDATMGPGAYAWGRPTMALALLLALLRAMQARQTQDATT